jgi:rod shape-determining protein MreC
MQRLLAFIEQNVHYILFILLQVFCGILLFNLNPYQQASFTHSAGAITDRTNELTATVTGYFDLQNQNIKLQEQVATQFVNAPQNTLRYLNDTLTIRDTSRLALFDVIPAEVVYNTVYKANNIFVINKGKNQGVVKNMGVISSEGLAGIVLQSNANYSSVMSLLNTDMTIIPAINDMEHYSGLVWDNAYPQTLKLKGLNKLEEINVGDKVYTGKSSLLFPAGILIGQIAILESSATSQYFKTHIKTATNFRKLDYVYVILNKDVKHIAPLIPAHD